MIMPLKYKNFLLEKPIFMRKLIKLILKLFGLVLLAGVLLVVFSAWQVYDYAQHKRPLPEQADAVVVLGAAAYGNNPSPVFRERINYGIELYRQKKVKKIIFTGGTPVAGYPTEAEVAQRYARQKFRIPKKDIILENESNNTYDNLRYTRTLLRLNHLQRVIVVSDPDHLARAQAMADALGIDATVAATPTSLYYGQRKKRLQFMLQEALSLSYFRLATLFQAAWKNPFAPKNVIIPEIVKLRA